MSRRVQALVFVVAVAVFAFLVIHAGVPGLIKSLSEARWAILPSVLVWGVVYMLNTIAWRRLLGPGEGIPSFWRAYAVNVSSFAINYVTPLVSLGGEPYRVASASAWVGAPRAAASVVAFRVVHTLGQLLFWLTALPLALFLLPRTPGLITFLCVLAVVFTVIVIVLAGLFRHGFVVRVLDVMARLPLLRILARRLEPRRAMLIQVDEQLTALAYHNRRSVYVALAAEYVGRAASMLEYLFIARALGLGVDYATAFMIGAFTQFISNATFFIPFELGSKEGSLELIFTVLGLPADLGVYLAIVTRIRELIWIAIGLSFMWVVGGAKANAARGTT